MRILSYKIAAHVCDVIDVFLYLQKKLSRANRFQKRILGIINFNDQVTGLGDYIFFQENLCIMRDKHGVDDIDICIVNDPQHIRNKIPEYHWTDDWDGKKLNIIETCRLNPWIKNIHYFSSYADYNTFRLQYGHRYITFPSRRDQLPSDNRPIRQFYNDKQYIPRLSVDHAALSWANNIVAAKIAPAHLVVVHIRNNPKSANQRNTNIHEWERFIRDIDKTRYRVICVCLEEEIVGRWREIEGVFFSRDLGADFVKECALIQVAKLALFPPSGLFIFSFFANVPSYLLNQPKGYWEKKGSVKCQLNGDLEDNEAFNWLTPYQKMTHATDNYENLCKSFNELNQYLSESIDHELPSL
jgi:hypothetical protein